MGQVKLSNVKREFARWRASKRCPGEAIPDALWALALAAERVHGRSRTAAELGLNHPNLKRRAEASLPAARETRPTFVELPLADVLGTVAAPAAEVDSLVEIEDASGFRLRLVLRGAQPQDVAAAARELWSARP